MRFRWWQVGVLSTAAGVAVVCWWGSFTSAPSTSAALSAAPPNVILISLDTVRPDHLGCGGYSRSTSPNLDRFAKQAVRFSQARCQVPLTLPSHMSVFTSQLPSHHMVEQYEAVLPSEVGTLTQILQAHGYATAALVNNAQVQARWGFNRGFDSWKEFESALPEGNCENLTAEALAWLARPRSAPFFLFLHYYDAHAPYWAPGPYREAFGSGLSGPQIGRLLRQFHEPENPIGNAHLFEQVIGAYDASINWLDHELGRLLDRVPDNTLVVVFSDHGEDFKEHGWLVHGATLYEEAIRTVLMFRHPQLVPEGQVVDEPVMLLDVAPTILGLCGIPAPRDFEGTDLSRLWQGGRLPERPTLAEVNAFEERGLLKMAQVGEWKLIYSLFDGKRQLCRLPEEQGDFAGAEPGTAQALFAIVRDWMEEQDYWTLYARGTGNFVVTLKPPAAQFDSIIRTVPSGANRGLDEFRKGPNCRWLRWQCSPGGGAQGLYFQVTPRDSPLEIDCWIDGRRVATEKTFLGPSRVHPRQLPWQTELMDALSSPVIEERFQPGSDGLYVQRHRGKKTRALASRVAPLDQKTVEQLKTLGYLR